tara:strand:- start:9739 stop:10668 length:930 start_codon:yes stop_codon:yes gene_type:complete
MTAQTWIDETKNLLLTDYVEEHDVLATDVNDSGTSFNFTHDAAGIVAGSIIEIGTELMYVFSVNATNNDATVKRGFRGTTAAAHSQGDLVTVNPKFPAQQVLDAINDQLNDLSSPQNGLYQMKTVDFTFNAAQDGYDLTGVTDDIISVYQVTYSDVGAEAAEPVISSWSLRRDRNTSSFASGYALILHDDGWAGQTVRVQYKTGFTALSATSTALSTVGLHSSAYDLPALGAALKLMSTRPVRREFIDEQGSSRRADEVPAGAISASMRDLRGLLDSRINAEATRLDSQYPTFWMRSGGKTQNSIYRGV